MVAGSALLVCCLATLASSFAPIVAPRAAATTVGAAPRWVDGPGDIEEAARVSKFTSNAVSVLYFSLASTHASALSTFELLAAALPGAAPGMGDTIKRQQDAERAGMDGLPRGARRRRRRRREEAPAQQGGPGGQEGDRGPQEEFDQMARDMGKDTAEVQKKLSRLVRRERAGARAPTRPRPRPAARQARELDRLFAMDADSSDAPADGTSDFEAFLENRRKGGTDADFYAKQKGAEDEPGAGDDDDWLGKIKYTPPSK
ncbi:hypothetical protein JL722_14673 [Aureococcus anophagefferens]|nr:hypothetical protein JL722_14673 [Aureococcus anophagefferens]